MHLFTTDDRKITCRQVLYNSGDPLFFRSMLGADSVINSLIIYSAMAIIQKRWFMSS